MRHVVFLAVRELPLHDRPIFVYRAGGCTYVVVQPGTTWAEVVDWSIEHLTVRERDAYRAHLGCGPVGTRIPDEVFYSPVRVPNGLMTTAERRRVCEEMAALEHAG